jgi:nucleoid-associated protein YgaU
VRALLLVLVGTLAAACGDGSSARLVSADAVPRDADGCVAPEPKVKRAAKTWTVREGDSLRRIARKCYGDENLWKAIAAANPGKIGREDSVQIGAELTIPYDGI